MSFKKPFRAKSVEPGAVYRAKIEASSQAKRKSDVRKIALIVAGGVLVGAVAGLASIVITSDSPTKLGTALRSIAVSAGLVRARIPEAGDHWAGCDSARAAGTAPIYSNEPGYREDMDGDGDGIACEPLPH